MIDLRSHNMTSPKFQVGRRSFLCSAAGSVALGTTGWGRSCAAVPDDPAELLGASSDGILDSMRKALDEKIVDAWYPRCLDQERGGFHQEYDRSWDLGADQRRSLIYQARMTWTPAFLAMRNNESRTEELKSYARHGIDFLAGTLWDQESGGFREQTTPDGDIVPSLMPIRNLYAQAFGIYACATAFESTEDPRAFRLAVNAFEHVERSARDPEYGGYFEHWTPEGEAVKTTPEGPGGLSMVGRFGRKSMNAHIHLLEAYTALYRVVDNKTVQERLFETFRLVRDAIVAPSGALVMFADRRWRPEETHSSFGHELEIVYLLDVATELLGLEGEELTKTQSAMSRLVRHSLEWGLDDQHGGFYNEGPTATRPDNRRKVWWVQAEAWNGLLTGVRRLEELRPACATAFLTAWHFFETSMLDDEFGGCYSEVEESGKMIPGKTDKANAWKTAYHVTRGLAHSIDSLSE
jgi:cellobiose epimerase